MPTYEYACARCKARYDLRQGFDAELTHTCEECGKGIAKRVLHAPRVVFKGSGWYATDSKKSKSAVADSPSTDGGDSGDSDSGSSSSETTEAPAAKAEKPEKKSASKSSSSGSEAAAAG